MLQRFDESLRMAKAALAVFVRIGSLQGQANSYISIGNTYIMTKRFPEATSALDKALDIATRSGDRVRQATALAAQGGVFLDSRRFAESVTKSEAALKLFQALRDPYGEAGALANLGLAQEQQGKNHEALRELTHSVDLYQANGIGISQLPEVQEAIAKLKRR